MQYLEEFIEASDGHEIPVRIWRPKKVNHILVIVHGMAEYCERYAQMAEWLTESDIAVVALNQRGHGMDCPDYDLGFFAVDNGWDKLISDIHLTIDFARKQIPDAPVSLFGHSMGSFISQYYFQKYGAELSNLILSATNRVDRPKIIVSKFMVSALKKIYGARATSKLIDFLSFGAFNAKFKPNRTEYDWLSRDEAHVDEYVNDPYCGFSCTLQMWHDFLDGLLQISAKEWPKNKPVYLLSGSHDAVGEFGKGVSILAEQLKAASVDLKALKLYPEARHEIVGETNKEEVWNDIKLILTNKFQ